MQEILPPLDWGHDVDMCFRRSSVLIMIQSLDGVILAANDLVRQGKEISQQMDERRSEAVSEFNFFPSLPFDWLVVCLFVYLCVWWLFVSLCLSVSPVCLSCCSCFISWLPLWATATMKSEPYPFTASCSRSKISFVMPLNLLSLSSREKNRLSRSFGKYVGEIGCENELDDDAAKVGAEEEEHEEEEQNLLVLIRAGVLSLDCNLCSSPLGLSLSLILLFSLLAPFLLSVVAA